MSGAIDVNSFAPKGVLNSFAPKVVLAATDLSDAGDAAILTAHRVAERHGAELIVLHVMPSVHAVNALFPQRHAEHVRRQLESIEISLQRLADRVARLTGRTPDDADLVVTHGDVVDVILETAEAGHVELIVVGHGVTHRFSELLFSSVVERVVRHAAVPVLVARGTGDMGVTLAATDFSDPGLPALHAGAAHAEKLVLLHTVDYLTPQVGESTAMLTLAHQRLSDEAAALGVPDVQTYVHIGGSGDKILETAAQVGADLVVLGRPAAGERGPLGGPISARLAAAVARQAPCSVLVVPLQR